MKDVNFNLLVLTKLLPFHLWANIECSEKQIAATSGCPFWHNIMYLNVVLMLAPWA